jgi:hypothetical protein
MAAFLDYRNLVPYSEMNLKIEQEKRLKMRLKIEQEMRLKIAQEMRLKKGEVIVREGDKVQIIISYTKINATVLQVRGEFINLKYEQTGPGSVRPSKFWDWVCVNQVLLLETETKIEEKIEKIEEFNLTKEDTNNDTSNSLI